MLNVMPGNIEALLRTIGEAKRAADADYDSPSRAELEDFAKDLHKVGERGGKDDYDKRLTALANDFLPDLNLEDRGRFFEAIFDNDPGAAKSDSWLQASRLDKLVNDDKISSKARGEVLEGFAKGYNEGQVDTTNAWRFMEMEDTDAGIVTEGTWRTERNVNKNTSHDVFPRFMTGLENDASGEFAEFIGKFAIDQIENGALGDKDKNSTDRAAHLGLMLNAADHAGKDGSVINQILHGVSSEKRDQVIDDISQNFSKITTDNAWLDWEGKELPDTYNKDPMELLIRAVANDGNSLYADGKSSHAADLAEYILDQSKNNPWGDNGFFNDENIPKEGRQEALNDLVTKKGAEIFNVNGLGEAGIDASQIDGTTRNMKTMANLMRLTGLSPTNDAAPDVLASLARQSDSWSKDLVAAVEGDDTNSRLQAEHKLTHMVASAEQAVLDGFSDKAEDDAARQEDFANMINLFLGFAPGGTSLTGNLKPVLDKAFTRVFGEDSQASRILDKVAEGYGENIDSVTSGQWRDKLAESLTKSDYQDAYLEDFRQNANGFIEDQVLRGLEGEDLKGYRDEIVKEASQLLKAA